MRLLAALLVLLTLPAAPAASQEGRRPPAAPPRLALTGLGAVSVRQNPGGTSFRDLVSLGGRLTYNRSGAAPFIQGDQFRRPDLVCVPDLPCNDEGWVLRAGVESGTGDDQQVGLHAGLLLGLGVGSSEQTAFSYLGGLSLTYSITPRIAPRLELRYDRVPGLRNIFTVSGAIRLGFF